MVSGGIHTRDMFTLAILCGILRAIFIHTAEKDTLDAVYVSIHTRDVFTGIFCVEFCVRFSSTQLQKDTLDAVEICSRLRFVILMRTAAILDQKML